MRVAILGAGVLGRLLAIRLAARHKISLYERRGINGVASAGYVAAGMLAPLAESVTAGPLITQLGFASLDLWPSLLAQLPAPVYFQREGTLIVAHSSDRGDYLSFNQRLKPAVPGNTFKPQTLDSHGIAQLEPALAGRFNQGLLLPGEGQLCNRSLFQATRKALSNIAIHEHCDAHLYGPGRILANGKPLEFDVVLDCRGLGAKPQWPQLRGVRGEIARVYAPDVILTRPVRLMHPRYPLYIAPKPNHQYVIGATEIESNDSGEATVRSALELLSAAYAVHPAFAEARLLEIKAGLRPALDNNLPAIRIGRRCLQINGLYRHGFLVAPQLLLEVEATLETLSSDTADTLCARREQSDFTMLYQPMDQQDDDCLH